MSFRAEDVITRVGGVSCTPAEWADNYKDTYLQKHHDSTQMDIVLPDDCLVVAGPPRLSYDGISATSDGASATDTDNFLAIGFITSLSITETRQVQPMKGLGSYRHVFTATNSPVQLQIERMLIDGYNLLHTLYGRHDDDNTEFHNQRYTEGNWYMNLEDDIYRIPFGLGICYSNPRTLSRVDNENRNYMGAPGADYFEACVIQSCNMSIQQGTTVIMENVSMYADRRVPFIGYFNEEYSVGDVSDVITRY